MIRNQEKARQDLDKKIKQYNDVVQKKARESRSLLGTLTKLRQDAQKSQVQMELLERETKRIQGSMGELTQNIARANNTLADLLIKLRGRILDMYKYSSQEELNLLLSTENTHEALTTAYMLNCLSRQDQSIIEELSARADELSRSRAKLEASRDQLQKRAAELKARRTEFNATIQRTNTLLHGVQSEQKKAQNAARELAAAQKEIGERITSLLRMRGGGKQNKTVPQPAKPQAPGGQTRNYTYLARGAPLEWPLRGPVAAPFGSRIHPVFKTKVFNSGIDIKAARGTQVRAAGPGEVIFQGWLRGFGQVVIINHGGQLTTVYANLASVVVKEGDAVKTGMLLGAVGNSGVNTEYGLHFEVRRGGAAQNPMSYLRKV